MYADGVRRQQIIASLAARGISVLSKVPSAAQGPGAGLARGLGGQDLIFSERFRAGGGTTLRGFEQNTLGPVDFVGDPAGGDALLLLNNEARFPLFSILEGVGFFDLGNVYRNVGDFSLSDVRRPRAIRRG